MPSMLARHEASFLLCLDRFPVMDISRQLQSITRDETFSVALPPRFEHDQINDQATSRSQANTSTSYDPFSSRFFGRIPNQFASQSSSLLAASHPERRSSLIATSIADQPSFHPQEMLASHGRPSEAFSALGFSTKNHSRSYSNDYERVQYSNSTSTSFTQDYEVESASSRPGSSRLPQRYNARRRPYNQDEFDGPSHLLPPPTPQAINQRATDLPTLPINLVAEEQDEILTQVNAILSQCAFHFLAKYQFPIPIERDKPQVYQSSDREWTEWAYLLKRLATKRRIPARVLYKSQIKHLVTTLENSLDIRYNPRDQTRPLKDDRNILQLISAALQVAKILMDAVAMQQLDDLYARSETLILQRRARPRGSFF